MRRRFITGNILVLLLFPCLLSAQQTVRRREDSGVNGQVTTSTTDNFRVRQVQIETNDMVYDRVSKRIYASIPGHVEDIGNTITVINPVTAKIEQSIPIGSEPTRMAISDDGRYLYVLLEGANAIRRLSIPNRKPELQFPKGNVGIEDMKVPPGHPNWLVVAKFNHGLSPRHAGDSLYIDGVERPGGPQWGPNVFFFSTDGNYAYGLYNELGGSGMGRRRISERGWGDAEEGILDAHENADDVQFDNGFFFTSTGRIYDVNTTHRLVGTFVGGGGLLVPDAKHGLVYFLQVIDKRHWLATFNMTTLRPLGGVEILDVHGDWKRMVSWNPNSFAFRTTEKQIFLIDPVR